MNQLITKLIKPLAYVIFFTPILWIIGVIVCCAIDQHGSWAFFKGLLQAVGYITGIGVWFMAWEIVFPSSNKFRG